MPDNVKIIVRQFGGAVNAVTLALMSANSQESVGQSSFAGMYYRPSARDSLPT